jgi:hypothetical protein
MANLIFAEYVNSKKVGGLTTPPPPPPSTPLATALSINVSEFGFNCVTIIQHF